MSYLEFLDFLKMAKDIGDMFGGEYLDVEDIIEVFEFSYEKELELERALENEDSVFIFWDRDDVE